MKNKIFSMVATFILPIALFVFSPYWGAYFSDKKELSYEILGKRELTNLGSVESAWPGIKILYEGQDVSTGSFLTLAIINTGKLPIKREDFDSPIILHIPDTDSVLSSKSIYSNPPNLDVNVAKIKEGIAIAPMLLNPGDRFFVEIFSKSPLALNDVTSRIVGIPSLSKAKPEPRSGFYVGFSSLVLSDKSSKNPISSVPFWMVFALTHLLLIGTLIIIWAGICQTTVGAKVITFAFSALTYILALAGFTLCISYFVEILDFKKWPGLIILMCSVLMSAYIATWLRRRYFMTPDM